MYMVKASALFVSGQTTALTLAVCLQLKDARGDSLLSSHSTRTVYVSGPSQCRSDNRLPGDPIPTTLQHGYRFRGQLTSVMTLDL